VKYVQGIATALLTLACALATAAGAWWLVTNKPVAVATEKPHSSATVDKVVKEDDLNTITLTEEAAQRIGLTVASVETKSVRRVRVYGGEVTVPAGRTILVSSPLMGVVKVAPTGDVKAGQSVKAGDVVFQLTPLLTPDGRATLSASLADTEGQVNNAKTQVQLATIAFERAKRVHKEGAGSQRQVDEAEAAFNLAAKTLDATIARQNILKKVVGNAEAGTAAPIPIEAPEDGILRTVSVRPGQTVPSGAALFEVIDVSTTWLRVPLPVGDLDDIDRTAAAEAGQLSAPAGSILQTIKPVDAPPSANPLSATVDLFYELPNPDGKFIPGQRLGVSVPLNDNESSLTVPWSAVVFDMHGGTWVYEQLEPRRFNRRRVVVAYTSGSDAVLASGPPAGATVVTTGVQELFGAETGFVK
jgi:cobalt-zinc-cadmium efflux system membrane fusion protein